MRVTLEYAGDAQAFHQALKAALKVLYRTFKLRCVGLTELPPDGTRGLPPAPTGGQAPDPKTLSS